MTSCCLEILQDIVTQCCTAQIFTRGNSSSTRMYHHCCLGHWCSIYTAVATGTQPKKSELGTACFGTSYHRYVTSTLLLLRYVLDSVVNGTSSGSFEQTAGISVTFATNASQLHRQNHAYNTVISCYSHFFHHCLIPQAVFLLFPYSCICQDCEVQHQDLQTQNGRADLSFEA